MMIAPLRSTSVKQSYSVIFLLPFIPSLLFFREPWAEKFAKLKKKKQIL